MQNEIQTIILFTLLLAIVIDESEEHFTEQNQPTDRTCQREILTPILTLPTSIYAGYY